MPASRQAGTTSCSMSRTRRLYCGCSVTGGVSPSAARHVDRLGHLPAEVVGEAVVGDLAGAHRVVEEAQRLLDRRQRVPGVHLVEVDPLDPEPPERGVERVAEMPARGAEVVRPLPHREARLGRHHHLPRLGRVRLQPAPDDLLRGAGAVDVGGVDEVAARRGIGVEDARARSASSASLPKVIVPRQRLETTAPLLPSLRYSIGVSPSPGLQNFWKTKQAPSTMKPKPTRVVPAQRLAQPPHREDDEDRQGDDLLDGLELRGVEIAVAEAVGRHHEDVLEERDPPADQDRQRQRHHLELRCPYQAKVMKTFDRMSRPTVSTGEWGGSGLHGGCC